MVHSGVTETLIAFPLLEMVMLDAVRVFAVGFWSAIATAQCETVMDEETLRECSVG